MKRDTITNDTTRIGTSRGDIAGTTAVGETGAGATVAGADTGVVGSEVVSAAAICGAIGLAEAVPAKLAAVLSDDATTAAEGVDGIDCQICGWSRSYIFCKTAMRAAAWAKLSAAQTGLKPKPMMTHKARKILIPVKFSDDSFRHPP